MNPVRFVDLFSGIGGFRLAWEQAGARCFFSSEINAAARRTYAANFGDEPSGDIRQIKAASIPDFDVLCAGFPCQPFSIAGVSKKNSMGRPHGFDDPTSGNLFFEIIRILKHHQPSAIMLENVRNLQAHDKGRTFAVIKSELERIGYRLFIQLIDGSWWVPQKRQRIYIVGFRDPSTWRTFVSLFEDAMQQRLFEASARPALRDILETDVDVRYTLTANTWDFLQRYAAKHAANGHGFGFGLADLDGTTRTLSARYYKDGSEILIPQPSTPSNPGGVPRRLTPREAARLMGYPDTFLFPVSDSQAYKQLGNSVIPPVIRIFADAMVPALRS